MPNLLNLLGLGATAGVGAQGALERGKAEGQQLAQQNLLERLKSEQDAQDREMKRRLTEAQIGAMTQPRPTAPIYDRERGVLIDQSSGVARPIEGLPALPEKVNTAATRIDPLSPEGIAAAEERARRLAGVAPPRAQLPTEGERKAAAFYASGKQGYDVLEGLLASGKGVPSLGAQAAAKVGLGVGNVLTSDEMRQLRQSALMLSDAWLRYTSGAAVPESEVERFAESFIPRAGDDAATLEQKRQARAVIIDALRKGAGRAMDPNAVGVQPNVTVIDRYQLEVPE